MSSDGRTLPDFENPPVTETVLDVCFNPLAKWGIPHFGLYWQAIRGEYPNFKDKPPILLQRESFGAKELRPLTIAFELMNQPEARCWFEDKTGARLIQIQHDRFIHNWRKTEERDEYPRYDLVIRPAFEVEWRRYLNFLDREQIGRPEVQQCEVQYINHIDLTGWESFATLIEGVRQWPGTSAESFLPVPESLSVTTTYLMPENAGRLRIISQPAIRSSDGRPLIQLNLVARGRPASSETEDILRWFDLGREWIVNGFSDFTSTEMHKFWKRIR
jgi:uncharacterized protein (TIGR04255 family)